MHRFSDTRIMGIVNVTPDSFYDGGKFSSLDEVVEHALKLVDDGAHIIDVGGESTRPGAHAVSAGEECDRVIPVIETLRQKSGVTISVDTTKAIVADEALKAGAEMINDISGMTFDNQMVEVAAKHAAEIVIMHTSGRPDIMMQNDKYNQLIDDILNFLKERVAFALDRGVRSSKIVLDPGIGFGKSVDDNYKILCNLERFTDLGYPVLIGLSRKSLIGNVIQQGADRLAATIALNSYAMSKGAAIIRVHDVKEHKMVQDVLSMIDKVEEK